MTVNRSDFQRRFKAEPDSGDRFIGMDTDDGSGDPFITDLAGLAAGLAPIIATDASAISFSATGTISSTDVQAAIAELDSEKAAVAEPIAAAHISDTSDAHAASAISFAPTGTIAATDVQAAIAASQPLDADLTAIAALSTTSYGRGLLTLADQAALTAAIGEKNRLQGVKFTGATGNYWSTTTAPLGASCTILDVYARVALDDWTPSSNQYIAGCGVSAAPHTSWGFSVRSSTSGTIGLLFSTDGTTTNLTPSSSPVVGTDGQMIWLWARVQTNNGGNLLIDYKQAPDAIELPAAGSFTSIGIQHTTTATSAVYSSSAAVEIGSISSGASSNLAGTLARVIVDANGVRKMDWRGDINGNPRLVDTAGITWTPTGSAWGYKVGST